MSCRVRGRVRVRVRLCFCMVRGLSCEVQSSLHILNSDFSSSPSPVPVFGWGRVFATGVMNDCGHGGDGSVCTLI